MAGTGPRRRRRGRSRAGRPRRLGAPARCPPPEYFERLTASARRIAHHASYPSKAQAVEHCREEVEHLIEVGRITAEQGSVLLEILAGASCPQPA